MADRSVTPIPTTLSFEDVADLAVIRHRLRHALRTAATLGELRSEVIALEDDIRAQLGTDHDSIAPDTVKSNVDPWEGEQAPSTPTASELGQEYGEAGSLLNVCRGEQ